MRQERDLKAEQERETHEPDLSPGRRAMQTAPSLPAIEEQSVQHDGAGTPLGLRVEKLRQNRGQLEDALPDLGARLADDCTVLDFHFSAAIFLNGARRPFPIGFLLSSRSLAISLRFERNNHLCFLFFVSYPGPGTKFSLFGNQTAFSET